MAHTKRYKILVWPSIQHTLPVDTLWVGPNHYELECPYISDPL